MEKHYARAKDATKLEAAIRAKLSAQAEFVLWWDTKGPGKVGAGRPIIGAGLPRLTKAGEAGLPDRKVVSRWRQRLNTPEAFEATFALACARYGTLLEGVARPTDVHVAIAAGENEWYTPAELDRSRAEDDGGDRLGPGLHRAGERGRQKKTTALQRRKKIDALTSPKRRLARTSPLYEATEKHFASAKDTTKLEAAIRAKLTAQAEFVLWWDTKGPGFHGTGGHQDSHRGGSAPMGIPKANAGGLPDRKRRPCRCRKSVPPEASR